MRNDERPPLEELDACAKGITIRNEIMHALVKNGEYGFRKRKNNEICNAYSAVLKVYYRYVAAIESRLNAKAVPDAAAVVPDNNAR